MELRPKVNAVELEEEARSLWWRRRGSLEEMGRGVVGALACRGGERIRRPRW
jgi:hypothetical protein